MSNEFLERLQKRIVASRSSETVAEWVCNNTTLGNGASFSLYRHRFQEAILNDMHPALCVKKLSQMGITEISIRKSMCFLKNNPGTSVLYTFPDINMKKRNAQTRFKPILDRDFPAEKGDSLIRNTDVMQMGNSFLYISANVEGDATSTPVDFIINDEYDLSDQEFLALVNSRIQHSNFKIKQGFSTPTFDGYGISLEYSTSDQREYWCQCEHCNHWQIPMYNLDNVYIPNLPDNVGDLRKDIDPTLAVSLDLDNAYVKCSKCGKRLNLGDDAKREWVAKYPDRTHSRGYWIRPFSSDLLSIKYLVTTMADFVKKDQIRRGVNTVLGEEYADKNSRLEIKDIMECMVDDRVPDIDKSKPCFVGIDVGVNCHLTISTNDADVVLFEVITFDKLIDRLKELNEKYNIICGAIDRHPQIILANMVRDWSEGRIYPVIYNGIRDADPHTDLSGNVDYYNINRTNALDTVKELINTHKMKFYGYGNLKSTITEHLRDMYRDDGVDGKEPRWIKMTGNDHFFHSISYSFVARKIWGVMNLDGEVEDRYCFDLIGANRDNKTLYNDNLLTYDSSRVKHTSKRLRW